MSLIFQATGRFPLTVFEKTIPNATILFRSFPDLDSCIGRRLTGHIRSHIFARIPRKALRVATVLSDSNQALALAAKVFEGRDPLSARQYHIQLSVFHCPQYSGNYRDILPGLPRYGTVPVERHLNGLGDDLLICRCCTIAHYGRIVFC